MKKLVFEDKKLTMSELIEAVECNFEGKEDVRQLLMSAPCYGNNDPYADSIAREIDRLSVEYGKKYSPNSGCITTYAMYLSPRTFPSAR